MDKPEMTEEEIQKMKEANTKLCGTFAADLRKLGEFDAVRVFAVKRLPNGETAGSSMGDGNYYATYGFIDLWIKAQSIEYEKDDD